MKFFNFAVLAMFLTVQAMADCGATKEQCAPSYVAKKVAVTARDAGDLVTAAAKYQEAASLMPMEIYAALDLLNAEGCLVGKWSPSKGYRFDAVKAEKNRIAAQAIMDQVAELLDKVDADKCTYDNGSYAKARAWQKAAQDALNGKFSK